MSGIAAITSRSIERLLDAGLFGDSPVGWLLDSDEPYARWATLTGVLGLPADEPSVERAHQLTLDDEAIGSLIEGLPRWGEAEEPVGGHHSPAFLPNPLNLLADMGLRAGDDERIETLLDRMLEHQDRSGRFESFEQLRRPKPDWGSLLCDTNAITDVLIRFGRIDEPRVRKALKRLKADADSTPQGRAWQCVPEGRTLFRGPGRKADVCPQVTLEGLRALSHLPRSEQPGWIEEAARTPLEVWRRRTDERPYMFGHGYQFKRVKWPNFWYDVLWVLETVGRFPALWSGPDAREEDRRALAELAACLVDYNFDERGRLTPQRTYRGFERFSFGQKKEPSPFATVRALSALLRLSDLAEEIVDVDVTALPSSKGGAGTPVPPRRQATVVCPVPRAFRFSADRAVPRVLARHHLTADWESANVESVTADIVALHVSEPATPYLSLLARLPVFGRAQLENALWERRSMVLHRGMRGVLYALRREMLPVVHAATSRAVVRRSREFARSRGITPGVYEQLAPRILEAVADEPLTTRELRDRLGGRHDLAATVALMAAEGTLLRSRPHDGWLDRQYAWRPLADLYPGVRLDGVDERVAQAQLLSAYVRAFGPVTIGDAAWWTGTDRKRTQRAVERLEDELVEVALGAAEEPYLMHAADVDELGWATAQQSPAVSLLPANDPLLLGYTNRARFIDDSMRAFVFDRLGNAAPVIVIDGRVAGVWDAGAAARGAVRVCVPADASVEARDAIEHQARRAAALLLGDEVDVEFVPEMRPLADRGPGAFRKPLL